jgi:hypothetical protein
MTSMKGVTLMSLYFLEIGVVRLLERYRHG